MALGFEYTCIVKFFSFKKTKGEQKNIKGHQKILYVKPYLILEGKTMGQTPKNIHYVWRDIVVFFSHSIFSLSKFITQFSQFYHS